MLEENRLQYEKNLKMKLDDTRHASSSFDEASRNPSLRQPEYMLTSSIPSANMLPKSNTNMPSEADSKVNNSSSVKQKMAAYVKLLEEKNPNKLKAKGKKFKSNKKLNDFHTTIPSSIAKLVAFVNKSFFMFTFI